MSKKESEGYFVKTAPSAQKLRGGYYTPEPISNFLADWAIRKPGDTILDPSCGDGNLLISATTKLLSLNGKPQQIAKNIHGVEIDGAEAQKAEIRLRENGIPREKSLIEVGDFFSYYQAHLNDKRHFDAIIGNPPFIRYQNFLEEHRKPAFELMTAVGLKPNRLTNSWVPFLLASSLLLNKNGRIAMVIPAELLQVKYAANLRNFLSEYFSRVTLITFRRLVFADIQQEIILFLGERGNKKSTGIRTIELDDMDELSSYNHAVVSNGSVKPMDHSTEKWTQYFLDTPEIELLREIKTHSKITISRDVIDVDVGVVTGLNKFFVLSKEQVQDAGIESYTQRIVGRSAHLRGIVFDDMSWTVNSESQFPSLLVVPPDVPFEDLPAPMKVYVARGEDEGVNQGYKCGIRKKWYIVPSIWTPDAFMLRQVYGYPKIVVNEAGATCTDTIHRIKLRNGKKANLVAGAFLNSLTFAFSEVIGRSYGGGVLELEPNEAEEIPMPFVGAEKLDLREINHLIVGNKIDEVLDITDRVLLIDGLGLSRKDTIRFRTIWKTLRDRRINRKHNPAKVRAAKAG